MLTRFLSAIPVAEDSTALVNNLVFDPVFVDAESLGLLEQGMPVSPGLQLALERARVVVSSREADERALSRLRDHVAGKSRSAQILYLVLTTECNLACSYCFIQESPMRVLPQRHMSLDTARRAIDVFIQSRHGDCSGEFFLYGGEPTLNRGLFSTVIDYIREVAPESVISVVTNGTLLDERLVQQFKSQKVSVGISLDGPREINDTHRVFKAGTRSVYDRVARSIELLRSHEVQFGVSLTVTPTVLEHQDEVLQWLRDNRLSPYMNPMHFAEFDGEWESIYSRISEFMLRSVVELGVDGIAEGRMAQLMQSLAAGRLKHQGCGALGLNQLAVRPNGDVGICQGDSQSGTGVLWNVDNPPVDLFASAEPYWTQHLPVNRLVCQNCEAFAVCGGGCPLQAEAIYGSRDHMDEALCVYNRAVARFLVEQMYRMGAEGGETWIAETSSTPYCNG